MPYTNNHNSKPRFAPQPARLMDQVRDTLHLLESGTNIRVVQKLMGHADVKTTEIYTHVLQLNLDRVVSPLERLNGDALSSNKSP